jgi:hypothetical protein
MKSDSVKSKRGLDLRAQAEQFAAERVAQADPAKPARDRAESIRDGLRSWVATRLLITEAYKGQDWVLLGYTSWELYCDREFDMKSLRLTADERNDAILSFRSVGMTTREIGAATGTSKDTVSRALKPKVDLRVSDETKPPLVEALRGEIEAAAERIEDPESDGTGLGSGNPQSAADGADTTDADGAEARSASHAVDAPAPDGGSVPGPPSGVTLEERIEEEAVEPPVDTPAAGVTSLPDGVGDPTPEPEQQPGHDTPTGREGGRSELDHQQSMGVDAAGEAPEGPRPSVEPVELEDGELLASPSSSDRLMHLFASLVHALAGLDADALGPQLLGEEMELLDQHVDDIAQFVAKLGKARFAEMLHTP